MVRQDSIKPGNVPPRVVEKIGRAVEEKVLAPENRMREALPEGIEFSRVTEALRFAAVYVFTSENAGELGRINVVYDGLEFGLKGLFCGINNVDDADKNEREKTMNEIYGIAKTAFAEE
jgi:hypothetical protein